jgi:hypothetical protein
MLAPLSILLLIGACTSGVAGDRETSQAPTSTGGGVVSEDTGDTEFLPGRFIYQFNSITAQAAFEGNVATMTIRNGTGEELGAPSVFVVGIDDRRYDGVAEGADPIADGEQARVEFMFPDAVAPGSIGLVVLTFGDDNVGAMAPVPRP